MSTHSGWLTTHGPWLLQHFHSFPCSDTMKRRRVSLSSLSLSLVHNGVREKKGTFFFPGCCCSSPESCAVQLERVRNGSLSAPGSRGDLLFFFSREKEEGGGCIAEIPLGRGRNASLSSSFPPFVCVRSGVFRKTDRGMNGLQLPSFGFCHTLSLLPA